MKESVGFEVMEFHLKIYLKKNISKWDASSEISRLIDKSFLKNEEYKKFHEENNFKFYNFNSFYPLEKDGEYKIGKNYKVIIRTVSKELGEFFSRNLLSETTDAMKVMGIEKKIINKKHIDKIYSITPIVIKCENGYWKNNISQDEYEKRLKINLIKKFNKFKNTKINEDFEFFSFLKFENRKPISTKLKDRKMLGDKLTINISDSKEAQDLTYFALGVGLGEINARGLGFVNFKYL